MALSYEIEVVDGPARPTAVIAARTSWREFPALWPVLLGEVWAWLRAGGIESGCRNVMVYRDDAPIVEVGVELSAPGPFTGRIVASTLPGGRAAMTTHRGSYAGLASAHQAVLDWCAAQGERVTRTRTRWEVYGPHRDDVEQVWTEVYWQLA